MRVPFVLLSLSLAVLVLLPSSVAADAEDVPAPGADDAMELLRRTADSVREVSFEGVQVVTVRGTGTLTVDVVHRAGEGTHYRYTAGARPGRGREVMVGQTPPLMKSDELLLDQLGRTYRVTRAGEGRMCGRQATVLDALRADGTVAGRIWVDEATGLPLRREIRDISGRIVHAVEFVQVSLDGAPARLEGSGARARPWSDELSQGELARLRTDGWHIPERPAWNLRLIRAWAKDTESGRAVHLAYSDGLSVVSVFAQRGRLPGESEGTGSGAAKVVTGDNTGMSGAPQQRMWDSGGFVYTAMGQAPANLLDAAAESFSAPEPPRFWARVLRGFGYLSTAVTD